MKFRLVGRNFQSWRQFDLNVSGFTVVVGSSNRGKTALIRALRGILRNQVSTAFIRHGQKAAELSLEVEKGPTVVLTRGKTTTYTVDGEDFAKLAGDVPQPLQDLKLHEIPIGTTKLDPSFAGQFDSQFMMNLSPGDLNAVFGLFSNTEQLNQGKKTINLNNTEINAQAKGLAADIQSGHTKIASMEQIHDEFESLRPVVEEANQRIVSARTVQTLMTRHIETIGIVEWHRGVAEMPLPSTESISGYLSLGRGLRQLSKLRQYVHQGRSATDQFSGWCGIRKWEQATPRWGLLSQYRAALKRIQSAPKEVPVSTKALEHVVRNRQTLQVWRGKVASVTQLDQDVAGMLHGAATLHAELHELTKDTTECPKCGYRFIQE